MIRALVLALAFQAHAAPAPAPAETPKAKLPPALLEAIETLAEKDPQVALRVYYVAGEAYQAQSQPAKAAEVFELAAKAFPENEDVLNRLVNLNMQLGRQEAILPLALRLTKLHPENAYYAQMVSNIQIAKGDQQAGLSVWEDAIKKKGDDPNVRLQYAQALMNLKRSTEALKQYEAAAQLRPQEATYQQQLAQAYLNVQRLDDAKKIYAQVLANGREPWAQREAGRQLVVIANQQKTLDALLVSVEASLAKDPANVNAHWQLIEGYSIAGQQDKLVSALERAAKAMPGEQELRSRLIGAYLSRNQWDKALELRKADAAKNPKDGSLKVSLAQTYAAAGRSDEAIAAFKDAVKTDPSNYGFSEQLAEACFAAQRTDEALKIYQDLLSKASEDWRKTNYKARIAQLEKTKPQAPR